MAELVDYLGNVFERGKYQRVVSLVPSLTKTVFDLGAENQLVGVTRFCVLPQKARKKADVGGTKNFSIDKILGLKPDLVIANVDENPKPLVEELMQHVEVFVTHPVKVDDNFQLIRDMAELLGRADNGYIQKLEQLFKRRRPLSSLKVFCPIWDKPWMSVNKTTYIHSVIEFLGFQNICGERHERYPVIDLGEVHDVDLVLLPSEPKDFKESHIDELKMYQPFQSSEFYFVDGTFLSWYGTQAVYGLDSLLDTTADVWESWGSQTVH